MFRFQSVIIIIVSPLHKHLHAIYFKHARISQLSDFIRVQQFHSLRAFVEIVAERMAAKNNTAEDFNYAFYDNIDDALIESLDQNQDFFSLLLNNNEIKHQVLGIFAGEIYNNLRQSK